METRKQCDPVKISSSLGEREAERRGLECPMTATSSIPDFVSRIPAVHKYGLSVPLQYTCQSTKMITTVLACRVLEVLRGAPLALA